METYVKCTKNIYLLVAKIYVIEIYTVYELVIGTKEHLGDIYRGFEKRDGPTVC